MANPTKQYPKDGLVIVSMLKEQGIVNFEPRVINQLLEFSSRYVSCVLDDARAFANHSKKKTIDIEDIKLSVGMQLEKVFTTPPPRELLLEVARSKNSIPLPQVKPHCGIRLPPDRYCFSACNYKLKNVTKKMAEKVKFNLSNSGGPPLKIAKNSSLTNTGSTTTVVKRPQSSNVARSQAVSAVAKPLIKLTTNSGITSSQPQLVQPKARIQITSQSSNIGNATATVVQPQQPQTLQQSHSQMEIKIEPQDNLNPSTSVQIVGNDQAGIKRKREDEFGGLETKHWRRLVIAVPKSSSSTYKVNRGKSVPWGNPSQR